MLLRPLNIIQSSYNCSGFISMSKRNLKWDGQSYLRTFILLGHTNTYIYIHTCICMPTYTCIHIPIHIYIYIYIYIYICMYVCEYTMYVCIYVCYLYVYCISMPNMSIYMTV